jgi:hypothetical protein
VEHTQGEYLTLPLTLSMCRHLALLANRPKQENFPCTNTLAYFAERTAKKKKKVLGLLFTNLLTIILKFILEKVYLNFTKET